MLRDELAMQLRQHPFLGSFRPEHVDRMAAMAAEVHFKKNEVIFRERERPACLYLLLAGTVALEVTTPGGVIRVASLSAGDEFGWSAMLHISGSRFRARTLEDTTVAAFEGERLRRASEDDYAFGYAVAMGLLHVVGERLEAARMQLLDMYSPDRNAHA